MFENTEWCSACLSDLKSSPTKIRESNPFCIGAEVGASSVVSAVRLYAAVVFSSSKKWERTQGGRKGTPAEVSSGFAGALGTWGVLCLVVGPFFREISQNEHFFSTGGGGDDYTVGKGILSRN